MITMKECVALAGLKSGELVIGASVSCKHKKMLSSYPFALPLGATKVCGIILADIRGYIELGVSERAADLLIVLRLFLSKYPAAHLSAASRFTWVDVPNSQLGEPAESAAKQCPRCVRIRSGTQF